jgi:outer membrane immunogenic protein
MEDFMKKILAAGVALFALASTAGAADLRRAPVFKALPPAVGVPAWSWTGLYVGINGGGGWGNMYGDAGWTATGGMIGGTAGYNFQVQNWVLGIEADVDWANITGSTNVLVPGLVPPAGCVGVFGGAACPVSNNLSWLGTVRGRVGMAAFDRALIYGTGGLAFAGNSITLDNLGSPSNVHAGYTVGAGMEYMVTPNWSIKGEYLWVDTGTKNYTFTAAAASEGWRGSVARAGLNYRFN